MTGQTTKDMCRVGLLLLAVGGYGIALHFYLGALERPFPLLLAFASSLVWAFVHDFSARRPRSALNRLAATAVVFLVGAIIAREVRLVYAEMVSEFVAIPDAAAVVGPDYLAMATNKLVGYGGCFAIGLLLARGIIGARCERLLAKFLGSSAVAPGSCPHCNQPISKMVE
jgi:FtsH-binding integral membrane protein